MFKNWRNLFGAGKPAPAQLAAVRAEVNDEPGWLPLSSRPHDYDPAEMQELYSDALAAWRKNPIAWRIIAITTDFTVGDSIRISSPLRGLNKFIHAFWEHPQNRMDLRLEALSDELARSGDLFLALFRNPQDGLSYLRQVTKDRIVRIETAENDWERELAYIERLDAGGPGETRRWLSPRHPQAAEAEAVMLHYAVNRPAGALLGEGDLTTMLPWLVRYSRMLEDRVRLHWAVRSFLWVVTVPANMVKGRAEMYRNPPESGKVIVKDESEQWEAVTPDLKGADARWDMQAVRNMIDAGSGYPPHWRGEAGDANLATATAMQGPTERHLLRRQKYFTFMLQDLLYTAYQRAVEIGAQRPLPSGQYSQVFSVITPEISRWDNESLARAAREIAAAMQMARQQLPGPSERFSRLALELITRFAGEPQADETLDEIFAEGQENGLDRPPHPPDSSPGQKATGYTG